MRDENYIKFCKETLMGLEEYPDVWCDSLCSSALFVNTF